MRDVRVLGLGWWGRGEWSKGGTGVGSAISGIETEREVGGGNVIGKGDGLLYGVTLAW